MAWGRQDQGGREEEAPGTADDAVCGSGFFIFTRILEFINRWYRTNKLLLSSGLNYSEIFLCTPGIGLESPF